MKAILAGLLIAALMAFPATAKDPPTAREWQISSNNL